MTNILGDDTQQQVPALGRLGWPLRRIEAVTGVRRETASAYLKAAGIPVRLLRRRRPPAPKPASDVSTDFGGPSAALSDLSGWPPPTSRAPTASACEPYRELIEPALARGRNAMAIWQDLVDDHGFPGRYASVRRFIVKNAQFVDLADLNRQAHAWTVGIANVRQHGTTREQPVDRLTREQAHLLPVASRERVQPFLRDERVVGRDGFVARERAWYGMSWRWAGKTVRVAADAATAEIRGEAERLAVHPRATRPGQRVILPDQWACLPRHEGRRPTKPRCAPIARFENTGRGHTRCSRWGRSRGSPVHRP
jgi:Mu transposase-like protein